jgi:hypothetical protein
MSSTTIVGNLASPESVIMTALKRHNSKGDVRWVDSRYLKDVPIIESVTDYVWCDCVPGDQTRRDLFKSEDVKHHYLEDTRITHMPATPLSLVALDLAPITDPESVRGMLVMIDAFALMRKGGCPNLVSLAYIMANQEIAYKSLISTNIGFKLLEVPSTKDHVTLKKLPQAQYYKLPVIENFLANTAKIKRNLSSNLRVTKFGNQEAAVSPVQVEDAFWTEKLMKQRFSMGLIYDFGVDRLFVKTWGMTSDQMADILTGMKKFYGVLDSVIEMGVA